MASRSLENGPIHGKDGSLQETRPSSSNHANQESQLNRGNSFSLKGVQSFLRGKTQFPGSIKMTRRPVEESIVPPNHLRCPRPRDPIPSPPRTTNNASENTDATSTSSASADPSKSPRRTVTPSLGDGPLSPSSQEPHPSTTRPSSPSSSSNTPTPQHRDAELDSENAPINRRMDRFRRLFSHSTVNIEDLRELAWNGIPPEMRPNCWRILLGYAPASQERQADVLERKRKEYVAWVEQYYAPASLGGGSGGEVGGGGVASLAEEETTLVRQILVDVPRTAPNVPLFHHNQIQKSLERILYIRAIRNPASGYVQGINDLVTPFLGVFLSEVFMKKSNVYKDMDQWQLNELSIEDLWQVEADCYWCLAKMLDWIQDHYTFAQPGIQRQVFKLGELVRRIDERMYDHIEGQGMVFLQFAFRWFNCLVLREVPFPLVARLWDTYLAEGSDGFAEFLVYVCAALLLTWADQLKEMEFQDMVLFLQQLPTSNWGTTDLEMVLSKAFMWRSMFARAQSHLKGG